MKCTFPIEKEDGLINTALLKTLIAFFKGEGRGGGPSSIPGHGLALGTVLKKPKLISGHPPTYLSCGMTHTTLSEVWVCFRERV